MEYQHNPKEALEKPQTPPPPPPPPPPSLSSSPSHEFSFTISFHAPNSLSGPAAAAASAALKLSEPSSSPLDFDLSPADDIFFNGHLLPLHFLSHRPSVDVSAHSATFLPLQIDEVSNTAATVSTSDYNDRSSIPKSFPLYWLRKWLKVNDCEEADRAEEKQSRKTIKKKVFNLARLWKKYTTFVEPFLFLKDWKEKREIRRSSGQFSFSDNDGRRRRRCRGGLSAPASVWTSPANSGLLVTPSAANFSSEELQNAIQAAIVHCKNSIAVGEEEC